MGLFGAIKDAVGGLGQATGIANMAGKLVGDTLDALGLKGTIVGLAEMFESTPLAGLMPAEHLDKILAGNANLGQWLDVASFAATAAMGGGIPGLGNTGIAGLGDLGNAQNLLQLGGLDVGGFGTSEMSTFFGALSGNAMFDVNNPMVQQHLLSLLQTQLGAANV